MLKRRTFLSAAALAGPAPRPNPPAAPPLSLDSIELRGWLAERLDRAAAAVEDVSSTVWWSGVETWGYEHASRTLRNLALLARLRGRMHPEAPAIGAKLIALVEQGKTSVDYSRNAIGAYIDGEIAGNLVDWYEASGDERALGAAVRKARDVEANWQRSTHYYTAIAVGRLLRVARASGDPSFRGLAARIAAREKLSVLEQPEGSHGAATAMIADFYLHLYEAVGEPRHLDWVRAIWKAMRERMMATGGIGETLHFLRPPSESDLHDETCQTAWWLILNLDLARLTGDAAYYDLAERIFYNHFLFQQLHRGEGGFHALGDIDQGFRGDHNYFCCDNEGAFALLTFVSRIYAFDAARRRLDVNFFVDSEAAPGALRIGQQTRYPERGAAAFTVRDGGRFTLRLRAHGAVRINGRPEPGRVEGPYTVLDRSWVRGDRVEIVFPLAMRVEADSTGEGVRDATVSVDGAPARARRIAVFYGPVAAAVFRTAHGNDLSWVWTGDYPEVLDSGGSAFEGYPGSRSELASTTASPPSTTVAARGCIPRLQWRTPQIDCEVRVLPGLPVTLEYRETARARPVPCAGLRFATLKTNTNRRYRDKRNAWPYPAPTVTTKPDLSDIHDLVYGAGTFGLYENPPDGAELPKTGTVMLNNGFFRAVSLYDPAAVRRVIWRRTDRWTGVYLEPEPGASIARRLVFPLFHRPQGQTTVRLRTERARNATARIEGEMLVLEGQPVEGTAVRIPRSVGLRAGAVVEGESIASLVWDYDSEHAMVFADVSGRYRIR